MSEEDQTEKEEIGPGPFRDGLRALEEKHGCRIVAQGRLVEMATGPDTIVLSAQGRLVVVPKEPGK